MNDNFIKDSRVFPEEMYHSVDQTPIVPPTEKTNKTTMWVLVGIVLLGLVFLVGWWVGQGRKNDSDINTADERALLKEREGMVAQVNKNRSNQDLTPEERSDRLNAFFGQ